MERLAILQNTQSATAARIATAVLLAPLVTYVVCSVSFPWLVARLYGVDLAKVGSRKLGGSNLAKSVGLAQGVAGGVLDGAKAFAAVLISRAVGLPLETQLACGVAASVAQMWPLFHRFDGGRANATGWGFAIAVDPIAALIMAIPIVAAWLLTALVRPRPTRLFPLASLLSFFVFPAVIWEQLGVTPAVIASLLVAILIVVRRVTAGLRDDLATDASLWRVLINRALYDRSELQERGLVSI
jgi:acyl-phosphate glycerol 3-phosphate acyltransferase